MFTSKRNLDSEGLPPARRFRQDCLDLAVGNEISAERSARLAENAALAGAGHVGDLARLTSSRNAARDLLRKAFRNTKWPALYQARIPFQDPATNRPAEIPLVFLLPHEALHALLKINEVEELTALQGEDYLNSRPDLRAHKTALQAQFGLSPLMLGLWIDGVPFNSDRSQTLECVTLSVLGAKDMRLPLCVFPKAFLQKKATYEAVLSVLSWSFRCLLTNTLPQTRHDGAQFEPGDAYRAKLLRKSAHIGLHACVAELRGDWAMLKEVLDVPSWGSSNICWLCNVAKSDVAVVHSAAPWRLLGCKPSFVGGPSSVEVTKFPTSSVGGLDDVFQSTR